jgi:hypothetical protein
MADMTQKHFTLIQDAINEAVRNITQKVVLEDGHVNGGILRGCFQRTLIDELGNAFGSRLRYTHDKFDSPQFCRGLHG